MSDQGKITIVTQKDLATVVESICSNIDAGNTVVTAMNSSAKSINTILSKNEMSNTVSGLEKFQKNIIKYNNIVNTILKTLVSPIENDKDFSEFLGRYRETDAEGNFDPNGKVKYSAIEAAQQIPTLISTAFKAMEEASSTKFSRSATRNIRRNMKAITRMFELIVSGMIGGFAEMSKKYDLNELLNVLVKQPDETLTSVKNNISGEGATYKDATITDTTKTVGRIGILDGIIQTFTIFDLLGKLNPPSFIRLKIQLNKSFKQLDLVLVKLLDFSNKNSEKLKTINTFTAELTKENGISAFFRELKTALFNQVINIFNKHSVKQLKKSIDRISEISGIFDAIVINIIQNKNALIISEKATTQFARELNGNITKLAEITKNISSIIINLIAIKTFNKSVINGISSLGIIFNKVGKTIHLIYESFKTYEINDKLTNVNNNLSVFSDEINTFNTTIKNIISSVIELKKLLIKLPKINLQEKLNELKLFINSIETSFNNITVDEQLNSKITAINNNIISINNILLNTAEQLNNINRKLKKNKIEVDLFINAIAFMDLILKSINNITLNRNLSNKLTTLDEQFTKVLILLDNVINSTLLIKKKTLRYKKLFVNNDLELLTTAVQSIITEFNKLKTDSKKINPDSINNIKLVIKYFIHISKLIIKLGLFAIGVKVSSVFVNILLNSLTSIADSIQQFSEKMSNKDIAGNNVINRLNQFRRIVNKLRNISINIILLGLIAVPVLVCIPLIALLLAELTVIAWMIQIAGNVLSKISVKAVANFSIFGTSILIILGIITVIGLALILLSNIKVQIMSGFMSFLVIIGATMILALAVAGIGLLMTYIIPVIGITFTGIALIAGVVIAILGICDTLIQLSKVKFNKKIGEALKNKISNIFDVITVITENIILYASKRKDLRRSKRAIKQIRKTVSIITDIADHLNSLQKIVLYENTIMSNVKSIFEVITDIENKIIDFNNTNVEIKNNDSNIITAISNSRKHKKLFNKNTKTFKRAEKLLVEINDIAEQLEFLSKFNITDDIKTAIIANIQDIFSVITSIEQLIINGNTPDGNTAKLNISNEEISDVRKNTRRGRRALNKQTKLVNKTSVLITSLGEIIDVVESLGTETKFKLDEAKKTAITTNVSDIMTLVDEIIKSITSKSNEHKNIDTGSFEKISNVILTVADTFDIIAGADQTALNKNISTYSGFIDKVNTVDVAKLETSTKMFAQMADFSNSIKGDFTKLAETLNENLMPVLQELKEIMGVIPEKLDTGFQNTSASIAATTVAPTQESVKAQVNRENPSMTKKEVDNIVQQRMKDYSKTEATGVVAKLDQLIELLKGYSGENVRVKTI